MKRISDFLGKPVISLYESNVEGYVKNVIFDKSFKKIKSLIIFEDNEFQEEKMLEANKIYSFGENAIVIKNDECLSLKREEILEISNHINCKVYTPTGLYIGIIADIEIDEKTFLIENVVLTNGQSIKPQSFFNFGQDIFFLQDETKPIKIANVKKSNKIATTLSPTANVLVTIQNQENLNAMQQENITNNIENSNENVKVKKHTFNNTLPQRLLTNNNDFLIGRKTTKTIYSSNNEIIVKKNINITENIIKQAIIFNKLRELTIYSI